MTEDATIPQKFNWFKMFWAGFTSMSILGKTLWVVVIVKLIIMFAILKPFFFPDFLGSKDDKASYVGEELVDRSLFPSTSE
ncbi:MAG: DUF4492 domain-containing protein [Dysgonamonadaceae bacterium]|jgi:hypothetical protein|nr:DUF4492 domain-containing protein [Dysgonamonadaceae bacterium]